jgi:hypothetical protein
MPEVPAFSVHVSETMPLGCPGVLLSCEASNIPDLANRIAVFTIY